MRVDGGPRRTCCVSAPPRRTRDLGKPRILVRGSRSTFGNSPPRRRLGVCRGCARALGAGGHVTRLHFGYQWGRDQPRGHIRGRSVPSPRPCRVLPSRRPREGAPRAPGPEEGRGHRCPCSAAGGRRHRSPGDWRTRPRLPRLRRRPAPLARRSLPPGTPCAPAASLPGSAPPRPGRAHPRRAPCPPARPGRAAMGTRRRASRCWPPGPRCPLRPRP